MSSGSCRRAFVVGISEYDHLSKLPGARLDYLRSEQELRNLGFEVSGVHGHAKLEDLDTAVDAWMKGIEEDASKQENPVVVVVISCHGIQKGREEFPYLLTSEVTIDADENGYDVREQLVARLNKVRVRAGSSLQCVIVLDCCRQSCSDTCFKGAAQALPSLRDDFYIIFACDPGRKAKDTVVGGALILAFLSLVAHSIPISEVFKSAAQKVSAQYRQRPWVLSRPGCNEPVLGKLPLPLPWLQNSSAPLAAAPSGFIAAPEGGPGGGAPACTIVLVGATGAGKSQLGNALAGKHAFETADGFDSCTSAARHSDTVWSDRQYRVIDTVGFGDTALESEEQALRFADYADLAPEGVDAFVVVVPFGRIQKDQLSVLRAFLRIAGDGAAARSILVFSSGRKLREKEDLRGTCEGSSNQYLRDMVAAVQGVVAVESVDHVEEAQQRVMAEVDRVVAAAGVGRYSNSALEAAKTRRQELWRLARQLEGGRRELLERRIAAVHEGREVSDAVAMDGYEALIKQTAEQEEMECMARAEAETQGEWLVIGRGSLQSDGPGHVLGHAQEYEYAVPHSAVDVVLQSEDQSPEGVVFGNRASDASLQWSRGEEVARVSAYVNGGLFKCNRVEWEVHAFC